jgi:hypothetical protein
MTQFPTVLLHLYYTSKQNDTFQLQKQTTFGTLTFSHKDTELETRHTNPFVPYSLWALWTLLGCQILRILYCVFYVNITNFCIQTNMYVVQQFNSRNGSVKAKLAYLCCHRLRNTLVKLCTSWDNGAVGNSPENCFLEYLTVALDVRNVSKSFNLQGSFNFGKRSKSQGS